MSAANVLPDDEVCACLSETGERKIRLYERCQRCGAFMEADYLSEELHALEQRNEQLEQARDRLRSSLEELLNVAERVRGGDPKLDPEEWYAIRDFARLELKENATARAALAAGSTGDDAA